MLTLMFAVYAATFLFLLGLNILARLPNADRRKIMKINSYFAFLRLNP